MPALRYAPIAFTTATEAKNIQSVLDLAAEIFKQTTTWIPTPKLNIAFDSAVGGGAAPRPRGPTPGGTKRRTAGRPKIYYVTQVAVNPITILMFVNKPDLFDESYQRFIVNRLQSVLPIEEVPIKLLARAHRKQ